MCYFAREMDSYGGIIKPIDPIPKEAIPKNKLRRIGTIIEMITNL